MAYRHVRIPHPQIGIKLQSVLEEEDGNFEYQFNDQLSIVTISSSDLQYLVHVQEKINHWISKIVRELGVTQSFPVHSAIIPLLCEEMVHRIKQLESDYDVRVTLTDRQSQIQEVSQELLKVKACTSLFGTQDIKITVPVYSNESRGINSSTAPASWYIYSEDSPQALLSVSESSELEEVFQYGGMCVKLLGEEHLINFKDRKLKSKSGKVRSFYRVPDFVDVPQQEVKVNICGLDHSLKKAKEALLELFDRRLIVTEEIQWSCLPAYSSGVQQQVKNFTRQFCILFEVSAGPNDVYSLKLKGAQGYVEQVHGLIEKKVRDIVKDMSPSDGILSPLLKSPSTPNPKLWETQTEKCAVVDVAQNSREWNDVVSMMKKTLSNTTLVKLERIQNADLWEKYSLEGRQMKVRNNGVINEKYLFHGTSQMDPHKIATSTYGIDFRCNSGTKRGLMWGQGAYFAENFSYSNMYAYKVSGDCQRQIMLVSILTGHTFSFGDTKCPELTKPPGLPGSDTSRLYDTVNGETGGSVVYVVYDHSKTCPAYILTYTVQAP